MSNVNELHNSALTIFCCLLAVGAMCVGACNEESQVSAPVSAPAARNDYQDMRNRGHSEEDAIIFGVLKQQGYSDYDAVRAMQSSKERAR